MHTTNSTLTELKIFVAVTEVQSPVLSQYQRWFGIQDWMKPLLYQTNPPLSLDLQPQPYVCLGVGVFYVLRMATTWKPLPPILPGDSSSEAYFIVLFSSMYSHNSLQQSLPLPNPVSARTWQLSTISCSSRGLKTVGAPAPTLFDFPWRWSWRVVAGMLYFMETPLRRTPSPLCSIYCTASCTSCLVYALQAISVHLRGKIFKSNYNFHTKCSHMHAWNGCGLVY